MTNYKKTTVVFPVAKDQILLGMKKRGFGAGWWNGFGGKLEPGETFAESALRETHEEVGLHIQPPSLTHAADLVFRFDGSVDVVTRAYIAKAFTREPIETEEMRPQWYGLDAIPYGTMWPGDDKWIPKILTSSASLPLAFVIDFTGDNEFIAIEPVELSEIKRYF